MVVCWVGREVVGPGLVARGSRMSETISTEGSSSSESTSPAMFSSLRGGSGTFGMGGRKSTGGFMCVGRAVG